MLDSLRLTGDAIPQSHGAQLRLVAAWFESIGFNRYNGGLMHEDLDGVEELTSATMVALPPVLSVRTTNTIIP